MLLPVAAEANQHRKVVCLPFRSAATSHLQTLNALILLCPVNFN